jgi:hypothetical protein
MSEQGQHTFLTTTLFVVGAPLAWLGAFTAVYVFAALACAKGFANVQLFGLPIVPVVTTATCALTSVIAIMLLRRGAARLRARASNEHERFIGFIALATSAIALIAFVLLASPPLMMTACRT